MTSRKEPVFYNPSEVAALFGVDAKTISRWANDNRFPEPSDEFPHEPVIYTPGGHRRFRVDVVNALVAGELEWA